MDIVPCLNTSSGGDPVDHTSNTTDWLPCTQILCGSAGRTVHIVALDSILRGGPLANTGDISATWHHRPSCHGHCDHTFHIFGVRQIHLWTGHRKLLRSSHCSVVVQLPLLLPLLSVGHQAAFCVLYSLPQCPASGSVVQRFQTSWLVSTVQPLASDAPACP